MKRTGIIFSLFLEAILLFGFVGCANVGSEVENDNPNAPVIGVSMPTKSLERWNHDGANIKKYLEEKGYRVSLKYADNKIDQQVKDIESLIPDVDLLLVSPVDGYSLTQVLKDAKAQDKPVISYDKLIMGTDAVTYYVSFDNFKVGLFQGQHVLKALGLTDPNDTSKTYNMELVAGEPTDNNATMFFKGSMSALQPYIDSGVIKVPSGQVEFEQCSTKNWDTTTAMTRMQNILATYYSDGQQLDICLCNNDSVALGARQALDSDYSGKNQVLLTGQDGDEANVANICQGKQSMTIYKPIVYEATVAVDIVDYIYRRGQFPNEELCRTSKWPFEAVFDNTSYDNGKKNIDSYILTPFAIDKDNIDEILIGYGFYYWGDDGYPKVVN